jgi:diacylglycerol O-acyltransferase / wax synthase
MEAARLSSLDTSFLQVETPSAHMHVGWVAVFDPPEGGQAPGFERLRDHVRSRLPRAPRYRQMLRRVPLGINAPVWVDDLEFDLNRHLIRAESGELTKVVDRCMSEPLPRGRPLWQMWIAPRLDDGRVAVVGKAHHCMVDGIAAVQLAGLLLDPTPDPPPSEPDDWRPAVGPSGLEMLFRGLADLVRDQFRLASIPARVVASPGRAAAAAERATAALADSARPARLVDALNPSISPRRHLGLLGRPIEDLLQIKRARGVKLNDVVLAIATGGVRAFMAERGDRVVNVKAMVPVNVRAEAEGEELGNRISFMFIDLPCDEPDPLRRLRAVHAETEVRKRRQTPEGGDDVLGLLGLTPPPVRRLFARLAASPRAFNLVVSNIPGPRDVTYMRGCRLREAFPVVPLADRHALSIGFTSVADRGCFGLYADADALPGVDRLAELIDAAIDELLEVEGGKGASPRSRGALV